MKIEQAKEKWEKQDMCTPYQTTRAIISCLFFSSPSVGEFKLSFLDLIQGGGGGSVGKGGTDHGHASVSDKTCSFVLL